MKKAEYSQIVRLNLQTLRTELTKRFGAEISQKAVKQITKAARGLGDFEGKGIQVSAIYDIECEYRYLFVSHNYLFYRIEKDRIIIVEMFDEREDFMQKIFGITATSQDTLDYWKE